MKMFLPILAYCFWVGVGSGQSLSASLQLNPKKLTGFFFGAEASHHEALRLAMSEFADNANGLQLVYVASERNIVKFNELKSIGFSANPPSARSFFGIGSQTKIGKELVRNFKVSALPTLLICKGSARVLDANGLVSLKSRDDPYAYWKSLESAPKPTKKKKAGVDAAIEELETRRLQIISSINGYLDACSVSLRSGTVEDAEALKSLRVNISTWLEYARTLIKYADNHLVHVEAEISRINASENYSIEDKRDFLAAIEKKKKVLINERDNLLPLILQKKNEVHQLLDQCDELLLTVEVLGREKAVTRILKKLADFQDIHFRVFK